MCSADWPLVVNLVAALGSCGAAIVAVVIATSDRRQRKAERLDAAKAQAMLVLVDVKPSQHSPGFDVWVHNLGTLAILDVEIDSATFKPMATATFRVPYRPRLIALKAEAYPWQFRDRIPVEFVDGEGNSVIAGRRDADGNFVAAEVNDDDLEVTVRFMDAHGHHWLRSVDSVQLDKRAEAP
jgi:hypothetical protein